MIQLILKSETAKLNDVFDSTTIKGGWWHEYYLEGRGREGRGGEGSFWRGLSFNRSSHNSSGIHELITPSIAVLQQSREVVWKASLVSTELVDIGDCRVTNPPSTTAR